MGLVNTPLPSSCVRWEDGNEYRQKGRVLTLQFIIAPSDVVGLSVGGDGGDDSTCRSCSLMDVATTCIGRRQYGGCDSKKRSDDHSEGIISSR
jgi:hypothetical protein